jgi:hypothetical protein
MYLVRSGSEGLRSFCAFALRALGTDESGVGDVGSSSDIKGRPAKARGADSLERMFSNVL